MADILFAEQGYMITNSTLCIKAMHDQPLRARMATHSPLCRTSSMA